MKTKLFSFLFVLFCGVISAQTISTRVGSTSGYVEGTGTAALFDHPYGIAIDGNSAVVVTDKNNNRVRIIYSDNSTGFWAGSGTSGTIIDGTGAAARFSSISGIARDGFNNAYVCDSGNNAIRKITSTGVVTTFAGGTAGSADGTGTAAQFNFPQGIAIDASGNLYVTDALNHRIRKITPAGVVTTLAGSTNGYADGTGTAAQFSYPAGIAVDASGNVFVGENCRIRKITPAGVVTTFAGGTVGYQDGNGTAAKFNNGILGIAIDNSSNLYVADSYNYRIRKITPSGLVSTYAGLGYSGTTDGDVSVATFNVITGIAINTAQNILYIVDHFNNRIREILPPSPPSPPTISNVSSSVSINSATIFYSLNANNGATTSVVKYGLSSGSLSSQVTGFSASGTSLTSNSATIPGLLSNTLYYYQIEATNSAGTVSSSIGSFTTLSPPTPLTIAEYSFDNTYNNLLGSNPFASNSGTSFTEDRNGNPNSALNISNTGSTATITGLPYGSLPRTISFWAKTNVLNTGGYNFTFSYGQSFSNRACGGSFNASTVHFLGYLNNVSTSSSNVNATWYYFTYTYDGMNAKIYKNGVLLGTFPITWDTTNNNDIFKLGTGVGGELNFNGAIDDLKIYNYVLSDTEISNLYNYNSLGVPQLPIITSINEKPAAINSTLYAFVNSNGLNISNVVVKYGLISGNLNNQVSAIGISPNSYYGAIINGLAENTTYYYKFEVTNDDGTTSSAVDSFTTGSKQTIAEYSFDNVYTDFSGNNAFPSNASSSFVADRNGNPTSALNLNNNGTATAIPGLPIDGSTRTVSLWVNNANANWNYAFSYGGILTDLAFIGVVQSNTLDFYCFSNGFQATVTNPLSTWMHLVYTYDGVNVRMYKNGVLVGASPFNLFTAYDADYFYLGSSFGDMNTFNGSVDDLKIYNYPLTQTEITNLYNNNTLSTSDFNQNNLKVAMYPNPVNDVLNIEIENEIKSVEIYNIQGQKVLQSSNKQIETNSLNSGIYMVRVEDVNGAVATQKLMKK